MTELEEMCMKKAREIAGEINVVLNYDRDQTPDDSSTWVRLAAAILGKHFIEGARSWKERLDMAANGQPEEALDGVAEDSNAD